MNQFMLVPCACFFDEVDGGNCYLDTEVALNIFKVNTYILAMYP